MAKGHSLTGTFTAPGEGGQTQVVNGLTAGALTAPAAEARRGWQKGSLAQGPSLVSRAFLISLDGVHARISTSLSAVETFAGPLRFAV